MRTAVKNVQRPIDCRAHAQMIPFYGGGPAFEPYAIGSLNCPLGSDSIEALAGCTRGVPTGCLPDHQVKFAKDARSLT